jgi:hypothetical protein
MASPLFESQIPWSNRNIPDLDPEEIEAFPPFQIWLKTLKRSLQRQRTSTHEFHHDPFELQAIDIKSVARFGGGRLGFVMLQAHVRNGRRESLPGFVLLRGGSAGILVSLLLYPTDGID